jgi:hypothetical protein
MISPKHAGIFSVGRNRGYLSSYARFLSAQPPRLAQPETGKVRVIIQTFSIFFIYHYRTVVTSFKLSESAEMYIMFERCRFEMDLD